MAFELDFLEMMPHSITIERATAFNAQGKATAWEDPVDYRCRISGKGISVRHQQNDEMTIIYDAWVQAGEAVISIQDRVTIPDDERFYIFRSRTPILFTVGRLTDEDGHHHVKLQFGWQYHRQGQ